VRLNFALSDFAGYELRVTKYTRQQNLVGHT